MFLKTKTVSKKSELKKILAAYQSSCNQLIDCFCEKQEIDFDGWIGGIGELAGFCGQYFFSFSDIVLDLRTNQPKGLIFSWQDDGVENHSSDKPKDTINYNSYALGLRYHQLLDKSG